MEQALCLTAAIAGAAWIAAEAYLTKRRLRRAECRLAAAERKLATLDAEAERHARVIVALHAAATINRRELAIDRIRIDRLDRAYYPGHDIQAN